MFLDQSGHRAHGAAHVAPVGNVSFPLVSQGFPSRIASARQGEAAAGPSSQLRHFVRFVCITNAFWGIEVNRVDLLFFDTRESAEMHEFHK